MRPLMHALVGLLSAYAATPAVAQLQWQSTGVQQVSHAEPAPKARQAKPAPKAPTVVRQAGAVAPTGKVKQAVAAMPTPRAGANQAPRIDTAVQATCAECGCTGGCSCGAPYSTPYYDEPGCAVADPGCGFADPGCGVADCGCGVEPGCGLTYGETCGCGDIGCGGACGDVCSDDCVPIMLCLPPIRELTLYGGVQAFKNPLDGANRDRGNFGFTEGVNIGGPMSFLGFPALGYQVGYRATQNQLSGSDVGNTDDSHSQNFITAGLFRRQAVGLQYGVVYDHLRDERQQPTDFNQLRGLISITNPTGNEIGFQFASSLNDAVIAQTTYQSLDQYLFFYRKHGCQGGEFRLFGGFDDNSRGIVGADASVPLTDCWSLDTGFVYVIPDNAANGIGAQEEAWNLGMNLAWHFGSRAKQSYMGQYRPMFNVADNGSMIIDDRN